MQPSLESNDLSFFVAISPQKILASAFNDRYSVNLISELSYFIKEFVFLIVS